MKGNPNIRCVEVGQYMIIHQCTTRQAAAACGVSKTTVHRYVTERLKGKDDEMYKDVRRLLNKNKLRSLFPK